MFGRGAFGRIAFGSSLAIGDEILLEGLAAEIAVEASAVNPIVGLQQTDLTQVVVDTEAADVELELDFGEAQVVVHGSIADTIFGQYSVDTHIVFQSFAETYGVTAVQGESLTDSSTGFAFGRMAFGRGPEDIIDSYPTDTIVIHGAAAFPRVQPTPVLFDIAVQRQDADSVVTFAPISSEIAIQGYTIPRRPRVTIQLFD